MQVDLQNPGEETFILSIEVSRFIFDEFTKFDEFLNMLLVVQTLQVVFIVNDW